ERRAIDPSLWIVFIPDQGFLGRHAACCRTCPAAGWKTEHTESEGSDTPADFDPFSDTDPVDSQTYKRAWARGISAASLALILRRSTRRILLNVRNADLK
ncbi:MAG: hypothetical protein AB1798_19265, partial [Spirochaetota bacterium]